MLVAESGFQTLLLFLSNTEIILKTLRGQGDHLPVLTSFLDMAGWLVTNRLGKTHIQQSWVTLIICLFYSEFHHEYSI